MAQAQLDQVVKQSITYSYIISQPFTFYVDAYPMLQNHLLNQQDQHIAYGDHSPAVRVIQQKLNNLSYYDEEIDGEFGLFTEYALKKFQIEHAIEPDGTLNIETVQAIVASEQHYYMNELKAIDYPLQYGQENDEIMGLQKALYYFGYYTANIDGIYGPKTELALHQAQQAFGLPETTTLSQALVETLQEEANYSTLNTSETTKANEEPTAQSIKNSSAFAMDELIQSAKAQLGVPYQWGGTTTAGFDCSGFVQYVFAEHAISIPRTVSEIWNQTQAVDQRSIGDLVFFETYKTGPSHLGIYLGNDQFIHAGESNGVTVSALSEEYWQSRYLGSRRVSKN